MSSLQPLATTGLLSMSMDQTILGILYKWNHTIYGLLCLATLTQHRVFKVRSFLWLNPNAPQWMDGQKNCDVYTSTPFK